MKNNSFITIIVLIISLSLSSCTFASSSAEQSDIANSYDLPKTLSLDASIPNNYPAQLFSYSVQWIDIDSDLVLKTLMNDTNPIYERWAEGDGYQYISDDFIKILYIYNGVLHGGINYIYGLGTINDVINSINTLKDLTWFYEPIPSPSVEMQPFSSENDLSFALSKNVSEEVISMLNVLGFQNIEVSSILARDAETLNNNRNIYNEYISIMEELRDSAGSRPDDVPDPYITHVFTEADEDYHLTLNESINGIPFSSTMNWVSDIGLVHQGTEVTISASYNQPCGIYQLTIENYFDIHDPIEALDIISPEEALEVYLNEYNKSIHLENTTITKIELNYVVIINGNKMLARPCWMIHTERPTSTHINPITNTPYYEYPLYAITADTGVILTSNEDMR